MIVRPTRRDVRRLVPTAALAALPAPAIVQAWPNKPIRVVCTYPPGGLTDVFARAYGEYIAQKIGQAVVVENKAGAAGAIGAEIVKSAPADGCTLTFTNSTTMVQNDDDGPEQGDVPLPYDPDKDFALVALVQHRPSADPHQQGRAGHNIAEFAAWAQGRKVSLATYGARSYAHVVAETLNRHYGLQMEAIHYRGDALMWQDVASRRRSCRSSPT
jgi:tripartite-type tricarboxylate transporter receptor subunit TctC